MGVHLRAPKNRKQLMGAHFRTPKNEKQLMGAHFRTAGNGKQLMGVDSRAPKNEKQLMGVDFRAPKNEKQLMGDHSPTPKNQKQLMGDHFRTPRNEKQLMGVHSRAPKNRKQLMGVHFRTAGNGKQLMGVHFRTPKNRKQLMGVHLRAPKNEKQLMGLHFRAPKNRKQLMGDLMTIQKTQHCLTLPDFNYIRSLIILSAELQAMRKQSQLVEITEMLPASIKKTNMNEHPLKCKKCKDFRFLKLLGINWEREKDKKYVGIKVPFLICPTCGDREPIGGEEYYTKIAQKELDEIENGVISKLKSHYEDKKFEHYSHLGLQYSSEDYYLIPGLFRDWNDGFLCPVFFDKDILLYYNSHPDYKVKLNSFSSGNIYYKNQPLFRYGFGINRNEKIFMWLGDINDDFEDEEMKPHLKRFQASNVESDHDIYSKYYLSQNPFSINDAFQDSDNEVRVFKLKDELDDIFNTTFGFKLTKIEIDDLFEYYKPPILEEKEQIFNAYVSLNKFSIENIQVDNLKKKLAINNNKIEKEISKLGSIKTLERFLGDVCKIQNISSKISPLYVLSDLRQLQGHLTETSFEEKYNFCKKRLGLPENCTHFEVYEKLVESLIAFYNNLLTELRNVSR